MAHPTKYPALNRVLAELVEGAQAALAENFCGAYLQGSFALGNADARSDVDFLIATEKETTNDQVVGLQALHKRIYGLDDRWAQHLEGSYAARSILRRVNRPRSPFLYLDNGASELIWDNHCNTAVVRWKLRECGVVLARPDPKRLVEPVTAAELRDEMREAMREYAEWAPEPTVVGWDEPLETALPRPHLLPPTAHPGDRNGYVEDRSRRLGAAQSRSPMDRPHSASSWRPIWPVASRPPAC